MRLSCARCDFLLDEEMFAALGSCPACGSAETREVEECARCGAAFPRGRSCTVCASPAPASRAERVEEDSFSVDEFLASLRNETAKRPPVIGASRVAPPTRSRPAPVTSTNDEEEAPAEVALPLADRAMRPLPSREERLPPPELLRELREEGRYLLAT